MQAGRSSVFLPKRNNIRLISMGLALFFFIFIVYSSVIESIDFLKRFVNKFPDALFSK